MLICFSCTMAEEHKGEEEAARAEEVKLGIPMHLAQLRFQLSIPSADGVDADAVKAEAMGIIKENRTWNLRLL